MAVAAGDESDSAVKSRFGRFSGGVFPAAVMRALTETASKHSVEAPKYRTFTNSVVENMRQF